MTVSIVLLGGFSATVGGRLIPGSAWHHRKAAELVKVLALAPAHRVSRDRAIDALWPGTDPASGGPRLRKAAFHARHTLALEDGVLLSDGAVQLAPGHRVGTDVEDFTAAALRALDRADDDAARRASARYGGELLPEDPDAPWCEAERFRLRDLYLQLLAAGGLWGRLVVEDPTDERAHREIMRSHLRQGNRSAAIRQFGDLRRVMKQDLGISPGTQTAALYERVLAMEGEPSPTPAERARALLAWAAVHRERADLAEAERTALEVRALAVDAGLTAELTEASELLGLLAYARGAWPEVFAREFLTTLAASPELVPFLFDANMCMSEFALGERDGPATVRQLGAHLLDAAARTGSAQAAALGALLRAEAGLAADDRPAAVRADLESADGSWPIGSVTGRVLTAARTAQLEARQGNHGAAGRGHRHALDLARHSAIPEHLLPFIYGGIIETAAPDAVDAAVADAVDGLAGLALCDPCSMAFRLGSARACAAAGEVERGRAFCAEAARTARMWSAGPWHAAVLEARAHVDHVGTTRPDTAGAELLGRARAGFLGSGRPREAERCGQAQAAWSLDAPGHPGNGAGTAAS